MRRTKISAVNIDPRLGNTYHNLRREAMTDEELLPEIRTEVEKIFLQSTTAEFQPIVIFPDISPKGCTEMLTLVSIVHGENLERRDATHIDPKYGGFINRKLAEMLRAKRVVRVSECWVSTYEKDVDPNTYIAPHLDSRSRDFLVAVVQHKGQTTNCITIMWEIVTSAAGTRTLNAPDVEKSEIGNPDLVL